MRSSRALSYGALSPLWATLAYRTLWSWMVGASFRGAARKSLPVPYRLLRPWRIWFRLQRLSCRSVPAPLIAYASTSRLGSIIELSLGRQAYFTLRLFAGPAWELMSRSTRRMWSFSRRLLPILAIGPWFMVSLRLVPPRSAALSYQRGLSQLHGLRTSA